MTAAAFHQSQQILIDAIDTGVATPGDRDAAVDQPLAKLHHPLALSRERTVSEREAADVKLLIETNNVRYRAIGRVVPDRLTSGRWSVAEELIMSTLAAGGVSVTVYDLPGTKRPPEPQSHLPFASFQE